MVFDSVWGVIPPERNTAWNKGRKCFHCLGAPNNLIRPWPYVYNTENSQEIAEELLKLQINENMRLITLDIKDMYVNLPVTGIMQNVSYWLNKHNNHNKQLSEQVLKMINTIVKENYF